MAQRCPFCKTRLWTDPWFSRGSLRCPRCGNEFQPTVHWGYFRLMVLLVVVLALAIIVFLPPKVIWIVLFVIGLGVLFWYFPRLIDLRPVPTEVGATEGVLENDRMEEEDWEEKLDKLAEQRRYRYGILLALVMALILVVLTGLRGWFG
ncbi:MAG TPA: hypothetical protein VLV83_06185 [Acidobacteriota bacterium]|nr:hypothetical protein [Acidobacteriota bacterium]